MFIVILQKHNSCCMLILYSAILFNVSVCSNRLFMFWNLNISIYMIILSVNRDHFAFWFPIWELLFLFYWLIYLARAFSNMLNISGKKGNPCFVLRWKIVSYWVWCYLWLLHITFIVSRSVMSNSLKSHGL